MADNQEITIKNVKAVETVTPGFAMSSVLWEKWGVNILQFLAPLGILYFSFVAANINLDGFQIEDFIPNAFVYGGVSLYVLNSIQDFLKKYIPEKTTLTPIAK